MRVRLTWQTQMRVLIFEVKISYLSNVTVLLVLLTWLFEDIISYFAILLHTLCFILHASYFMLHTSCFILHVSYFMLHIFLQLFIHVSVTYNVILIHKSMAKIDDWRTSANFSTSDHLLQYDGWDQKIIKHNLVELCRAGDRALQLLLFTKGCLVCLGILKRLDHSLQYGGWD